MDRNFAPRTAPHRQLWIGDADAITPSSSEGETLLTVEDAQERLAFNLVLPAKVTEGLELAGVIVGDNPQGDATPSTDSARFATLVFSS